MTRETEGKLRPLIAAAAAAILDQAAKLAVLAAVGRDKTSSVLGDFVRISPSLRPFVILDPPGGPAPVVQIAVFIALPLIILGLVVFLYFREKRLGAGMRSCLAAIIGGGLGNLVDRFARGGGVVEFIDIGVFDVTRLPAFNLADLAVAAGAIAFIALWIVRIVGGHGAEKEARDI